MKTQKFDVSTTHRAHIVALGSVRGIAALSIAVMHFGVTTPVVEPYFSSAYLMVDLFFVLSGFAIYYAYHDRLQTAAQVKRFVWLRFWRLYPIHFAMLAYFVCVELAKPLASLFLPVHHAAFALGGWKDMLANLLLLQSFNLTNSVSFNPPSWSISSEFYIYILFACVVFLLGGRARALLLSAFISMSAVLSLAVLDPQMGWTYDYGWVRGLAGFFAGVLTCAAYLKIHRRMTSGNDLGVVALMALMIVVGFVGFRPAGHYVNLCIIPLSAALILLVALSRPDGAISILASRPIRWLGVISYSIYMVHVAIGFGLGYLVKAFILVPTSIPVQLCLATLNIAAVVAVASITYLRFEMPFRAWSRKKPLAG